MKKAAAIASCFLLLCPSKGSPQVGTAFTYQGQLTDGGGPANGAYDLELKLFDAVTAGGQVGPTVTLGDIGVLNGLFTVSLDFGASAFTGSKRWLEIGVRPGASTGTYTVLTPRQELTPAPNAVFSASAATVTGTVAVANGGTGQTTLAANGIVYGQGTGAVGTAVGIAGQVLTGTAGAPAWTGSPSLSGNLTLVTPSTASAGNIMKGGSRFIHNSGVNNTFIGVNAGNFSLTGNSNTAIGFQAFAQNTIGSGNTATGVSALFNNSSGQDNTAHGTSALSNNSTGSFNTASGSFALFMNTTGASNTASGDSALRFNTAASGNTAVGLDALRTQSFSNGGTPWSTLNTAVGYQALLANQPTLNVNGMENTAIGASALLANTTGSFNTASGSSALRGNSTGSQNTAMGLDALTSNTMGLNNTAFGTGALLTNTIGNDNTAIGAGADVSANNLANATAIGRGATVDASNKIRLGNAAVTVIEGQVAFTFPSDRTRKENLRGVDAQEVLQKLRGIGVTSWNYIGHDPREFRHYGPMAQDFFAAFGHDEVGAIGTQTTINSGDITGILMIGLQGLDMQVQEDQRTIEAQAAEIASLKQQVASVSALLKALAPGLKADHSSEAARPLEMAKH